MKQKDKETELHTERHAERAPVREQDDWATDRETR